MIALYNASKRVSTIADHDNLFLFQVEQSKLFIDNVKLDSTIALLLGLTTISYTLHSLAG